MKTCCLPASVSDLSSAQLQLTLQVFMVVSSRHKSKSQLVQGVLNLFFIFPDFCVNRWLPIWFTLIFFFYLSVHFRKQIYKCLWLPQSSKILDAFYLSEMPCWFLSSLVTQLRYVLEALIIKHTKDCFQNFTAVKDMFQSVFRS